MHISEIIKYPILTEKTYSQIEQGIYTFAVDKRANKTQIKKVVEFIFKVKVDKVNVINVRKKPKRIGRFAGFKSGYKKAIVTLEAGHTITLFPDEDKSSIVKGDSKQTKSAEEIMDIEKRAAEKIAKKTADQNNENKEVEQKVEEPKVENEVKEGNKN